MTGYELIYALGLIPARAGNTYPVLPNRNYTGAHPRSRGEHSRSLSSHSARRGSSPLARGTHRGTLSGQARIGLIPARAGNTGIGGLARTRRWAHPRSRGEHVVRVLRFPSNAGSSPLARGTHLLTWDFTPYISKIESLWSQSLTPEYTISSHY